MHHTCQNKGTKYIVWGFILGGHVLSNGTSSLGNPHPWAARERALTQLQSPL